MTEGFRFSINKVGPGLARAGTIHTPHGDIPTPAFIVVGTKATVKALTPEMVRELGASAVLANTYHLMLEPGAELVRDAGGFAKFMHWNGPTFTDSGGFQVFSLGSAFGGGVTKVAKEGASAASGSDGRRQKQSHAAPAKVDEDGVTFKSHIDGSPQRLTPERSMAIQHDLGADILFAFDECTSPNDPPEYQREALDRTHRWAKRSLEEHQRLGTSQATGAMQALFGVVQGGAFQDLREESARTLGAMDFDGYGIGGSFTKEDIGTAVRWVNTILPPEKPRHLLGIGEPIDLVLGIENGVDTFDCVAPTRLGRNGALYTARGRMNITNAAYARDLGPIEEGCGCYTCAHFTRAYLAHLFRADEMLAGTLASIHNLYFLIHLVGRLRQALLDGRFEEEKQKVLAMPERLEK